MASGCAAQPPPGAITAGWFASVVSISLRSISRNAPSPFSAKISVIGLPSRRTRMPSTSTNPACSCSATSLPMLVFPEPGRPISTMCFFMTPPPHLREVPLEVPLRFAQRVAAELLEQRLRQHQLEHRLGDDPHRGHRGHIGPLGLRLRRTTGLQVHGAE